MTNERNIRVSQCPYCKKMLPSEVSCNCNCSHYSIDLDMPICSLCIQKAIDISKKKKISDYEYQKATLTDEYHLEHRADLNKRESNISQNITTLSTTNDRI